MNKDLEKYFAFEMEQDERVEFLRKVDTDPDLQKEFIRYYNMMGMIALSSQVNDEQEGQASFDLFIASKQRGIRRNLSLKIVKYAAAIIFIIGTTWSGAYFFHNRNTFYDVISENTITAPVGQRSSIVLSDGTQVWLNANSTLTYPTTFNRDVRSVKIKGEAYFVVAKNEEKPFVVSTSALDVKVLGTTFSIEDYPSTDSIAVCLIEGQVEVYTPLDMNNSVILHPMQKVCYKGKDLIVSGFVDNNDFLWKEGIYSFEQTPLSEIAQKLELYFDTKIIFGKESIKKYRFTGKFRQRDGVIEILKIMQKVHRFDIVKDEVTNTITLK